MDRDTWNTYGIEWDEDTIIFALNNETTLTYPRVPELHESQWPFDTPYYLICSMQIGGGWVNGSGPTNPEHYPAGMEIDWVRVYKRPGNA
ncbi:MAG: family 16 glycosylhydrolase [Gemmatimonadetes bacterium]|nr:family 16 glycosylhydrolase [Gemmatimonadota bacterium]MBT7863119.1 family 16 glycosylhydrolase [Gemmatimonadota bacterium]